MSPVVAGSWRRSSSLPALRTRLRASWPRPVRRWSELVVVARMLSDGDDRKAHERLADLAARQTAWRYQEGVRFTG